MGISSNSMNVMNLLRNTIFNVLAKSAGRFTQENGVAEMPAREIQSAILDLLPRKLARGARAAVADYLATAESKKLECEFNFNTFYYFFKLFFYMESVFYD